MRQDFWKKYDETELTHSSVHHLMAIDSLKKQQGYARLVDVSNHLNISRASVSITVGKLKNKGFVAEDKNRFLNLSEKGAGIVNAVVSKRKVVETFFRTVLKLSDTMSEINACKIEHLLDEEAGNKLARFISFYQSGSKEAVSFRYALADYIENGAQP